MFSPKYKDENRKRRTKACNCKGLSKCLQTRLSRTGYSTILIKKNKNINKYMNNNTQDLIKKAREILENKNISFNEAKRKTKANKIIDEIRFGESDKGKKDFLRANPTVEDAIEWNNSLVNRREVITTKEFLKLGPNANQIISWNDFFGKGVASFSFPEKVEPISLEEFEKRGVTSDEANVWNKLFGSKLGKIVFED